MGLGRPIGCAESENTRPSGSPQCTSTARSHSAGAVPTVAPEAATVAGDGVSPAASASASGSPLLGNAAATSRADWLRLWGLGSRHPRMARSMVALSPSVMRDGFVISKASRRRNRLVDRFRLEWGPAREQFKEDEAERVEVALRASLRGPPVALAPCTPGCRSRCLLGRGDQPPPQSRSP